MNANVLINETKPARWLLVSAGLLMLANSAPNEDWWILSARDAEGNAYLIDGIAKIERGRSRSYNAHFFYRTPVSDVASSQIEFYVNCDSATLREARYKDFDSRRIELYSGDNFGENLPYRPNAGTIGEEIIEFACARDSDRYNKYAKIDQSADLWALGEALLARN